MQNKAPLIPVSWGELFDKITILNIKLDKIKIPELIDSVKYEKELLDHVAARAVVSSSLKRLINDLEEKNRELWDIEDKKRNHEKNKLFDESFIQLARQVYLKNDERAKIKSMINKILNSPIMEVKSHDGMN